MALTDYITFDRADPANYFDSNGVLQEAASGEPRDQHHVYDPSQGAWVNDGFLIEPDRERLNAYPRTFTSWAVNPGSLSQDQVGIDGASNKAWTVGDTNDTDLENLRDKVSCPLDSEWRCAQFWVKKDNDTSHYPWIRLRMQGGTERNESVVFNTSNGTVETERENDGLYLIEDWDGWWRVILAVQNNGENDYWNTTVYPAFNSDGSDNSDDSVTGSIVLDAVQLEFGYYPSMPIDLDNEGSSVIRAADKAKMTSIGNWYNDGGDDTTVVDFRLPTARITDNQVLFLLCVGPYSATSGIEVYYDSGGGLTVRDQDGNKKAITSSIDATVRHRLAVTFENGDLRIALDGSIVNTVTSTKEPLSELTMALGAQYQSTGITYQPNGTLASVKYYPRALSNSKLEELTA